MASETPRQPKSGRRLLGFLRPDATDEELEAFVRMIRAKADQYRAEDAAHAAETPPNNEQAEPQ